MELKLIIENDVVVSITENGKEYRQKDDEKINDVSNKETPNIIINTDFMSYNNPDRQTLIRLVKHFESFYPNAYKDPIGVITIGYGTIKYSNGKKVQMGDKITEENAIKEMMFELTHMYNQIKNWIKVDLNSNQWNAILSFCYNCGTGNFKSSTLLKRINERNFADVPNQLMRWINAGGKPFKGLWRRRLAEAMLFNGDSRIPTKVPTNYAGLKYYPNSINQYI